MSETPDDAAGSTASVQPPPPPRPALPRGACVDRYIIVGQIGAGGVGIVYESFDPELGRPIALKLLKTGADESGAQRDRLLREAQALARLSHPNVIAVHDVGTFERDVFIAMEFVEGVTLRKWLAEAPRGQREILEVFAAAGDGLQAAHQAGLVHRDFKPDNVIVGQDGRVRVLDFGLARATAAAEPGQQPVESRSSKETAKSGQLLSSPMTRAGSVMGTPRYMAPEQHRGDRVDERADQFSFCLSLYEALYGSPPFDLYDLCEAAIDGLVVQVEEPPSAARVPRWLRQVLLRGLELNPAGRYASMAELLAALRSDPTATRRRRLLASVLVATAGLIAVGWQVRVRQQASLCRGAERKLAGVWDDGRRAAVRAAFLSSHTPYAETVLHTVEGAFDHYSRSWVTAQVDACEATKVRRQQPQEVLDLRVACLDDRLYQLKALVDVYTTADAKVVQGAAQASRSLPSLDLCADVAALRASTPPQDSELRQRVDSVRQQLANANALGLAARHEQGIRAARKAVVDAAALNYPSIEAEAQLQLARVLDDKGDYAESTRAYSQALVAAVAAHRDEAAARAAIGLADEIGLRQEHFEDGDRWALLAEAQVLQLRRKDELLGLLYSKRAHLRAEEARYDEALADAKRALEIQERVLGPDDYNVAETYSALAQTQKLRAKYPEALEAWQRCLAIQQRTLGSDHPTLQLTLVGIAGVYSAKGEPERAIAEYQRAWATLQRVEPDHPLAAFIHNELGVAYLSLSKGKEAAEEFEQALRLWEKQRGPSLSTTAGYNNVAEAKLMLEQPADALDYLTKANDQCEKNLGSKHLCGLVLANMGEAFHQLKRQDKALTYFQRSVSTLEEALGPKHPELAAPLLGVGQVELALHAATNAKAPLERALAICEATGNEQAMAEVRFALAQARWETGDHKDARSLATQAQAEYARAGANGRKSLAEVTTWLERHR